MFKRDNTFTIIVLLFLLVCYLGNKAILSRSNELKYKNSINILHSEIDSIKTAYFKLELYAIDIENICDKYKSSRDAKYHYHLKQR